MKAKYTVRAARHRLVRFQGIKVWTYTGVRGGRTVTRAGVTSHKKEV